MTALLARGALPDSVIAGAVEEHERAAESEASEIAERGSAIAREAGLRAVAVVKAASAPWRGLCAAAEEHAASLVVCGSRGHGGFSRAVLGSTSSSLLHHAPLPVLVVPAGAGALDGPVLIGYDGSADARAAIATTARLLPGRRAIVVHGWSSPISRSLVGESLLAAPLAEVREITGDLDAVFAGDARDIAEEGAALAREHGLAARPTRRRDLARRLASAHGRRSWRACRAGRHRLPRPRGARLDRARIRLRGTRAQRRRTGPRRPLVRSHGLVVTHAGWMRPTA